MSFIRPEVVAALRRWVLTLWGLAALALGLYFALWLGGRPAVLGIGLCLVGVSLTIAGVQRARLPRRSGGPGVVSVDEGRITYFGPLTGGSADVAALERLILDPTARPPHWVLEGPDAARLYIPVNAEGSDALYDAFAKLKGLRMPSLLAELRRNSATPVVVWEKSSSRPVRTLLQ